MRPLAYLRLCGLTVGLNQDGKVVANGEHVQALISFMQAHKPAILHTLRSELLTGEPEFGDTVLCGFLCHLERIADTRDEPNRTEALQIIWAVLEAGFDGSAETARRLGREAWPMLAKLLQKPIEGAALHYAARRELRANQPDLSVLD